MISNLIIGYTWKLAKKISGADSQINNSKSKDVVKSNPIIVLPTPDSLMDRKDLLRNPVDKLYTSVSPTTFTPHNSSINYTPNLATSPLADIIPSLRYPKSIFYSPANFSTGDLFTPVFQTGGGEKTQSVYHFVELDPDTGKVIDGTYFALDIVKNIDFDDPRSIVIYETIGGDGGYAIATGRNTQTVTLQVRFVTGIPYEISGKDAVGNNINNNPIIKLNANINRLKELRNLRNPVYIYKLNNGSGKGFFGKYLIQNVSGSILEADTSIPVSIKLVEYKSLQVKKNEVIMPTSADSDVAKLDARIAARNLGI